MCNFSLYFFSYLSRIVRREKLRFPRSISLYLFFDDKSDLIAIYIFIDISQNHAFSFFLLLQFNCFTF